MAGRKVFSMVEKWDVQMAELSVTNGDEKKVGKKVVKRVFHWVEQSGDKLVVMLDES
jgi:hypothetical protein